MKKIVHIITSLNRGGAEIFLKKIILEDKFNNHQVISLKDLGYIGKELLVHNIEVDYLDISNNKLNFFFKFYQLLKLIKKSKADIVQLWMYHTFIIGIIICKILKINKIYCLIRASYEGTKFNFYTKILIFFTKFFLKFFKNIVIIYNSKTAEFSHKKIGLTNKSKIILNGLNTNKYTNNKSIIYDLRKKYKIDSDTLTIGMIARYDTDKDHNTLFKALNILKQNPIHFKVLLAGEKIDYNNTELTKIINKYSLQKNVILLGNLSNVNLIYSLMDLHVLTSTAESFPNSIIEAMSCEVPCIASDVGDIKDIIDNCGWVFKPLDYFKLSQLILNYYFNEYNNDLSQKRKIKNRKRIIENYHIKKTLKQYNDLWRNY